MKRISEFYFYFYDGGKVDSSFPSEADYEWHVFNKLFYWLGRIFCARSSAICGEIINKQKWVAKIRESSRSGGLYDFIRTPSPSGLISKYSSRRRRDEKVPLPSSPGGWPQPPPLSFEARPWFMIARGRLLKYFFINFFANLFVFRSFRFRLKLECEKLASEKTEMQRHYVMVSERVQWILFHHPIRPLQWQTAKSLKCLISKSNSATTMPGLPSLPFGTPEMLNEIKKGLR